MTTKTGLSPAEQSRQNAKAALERQDAEKKRKEEDLQKQIKKMEEERKREDEDLKVQAVPIGEKLYSRLREEIRKKEGEGCQKMRTYLASLLVGLTKWGEAQLARHAFHYAAIKLRADKYRVRFGGSGSSEWSVSPYYDAGYRFRYLEIEIDWSGEESK